MNFKLWHKGQLIFLISRTITENDTFFGGKMGTLEALKALLQRNTCWTDYMETVLSIVTVNIYVSQYISSNASTITHENFPFRISDIPLSQ